MLHQEEQVKEDREQAHGELGRVAKGASCEVSSEPAVEQELGKAEEAARQVEPDVDHAPALSRPALEVEVRLGDVLD